MTRPFYFFIVFLTFSISSNYTFAQDSNFTNLRLMDIIATQKNIDTKQTNYIAALSAIEKKAQVALKSGPFSVMKKKHTASNGDKHDYLSMAPYFWPNPNTPNSLPYIRKDGQVNPETRDETMDFMQMEKLFAAVDDLSTAYLFTNNKKYADKITDLLQVWFINPQTKMNPNLNHAQLVLGENEGRPAGVIEFGGIGNVIDALEILKYKGSLSPALEKEMQKWFSDYVIWLTTSKIGMAERATVNNHSTNYDVQLVNLLSYLNKTEDLKSVLENVKKRIASQIEPDGSQPKELARTKSFSYSCMNLNAFLKLALVGNRYGIDLWNYETEDKRSLKKGVQYLIPFTKDHSAWKYNQINEFDKPSKNVLQMMKVVSQELNDKQFDRYLNFDTTKINHELILLHNIPN